MWEYVSRYWQTSPAGYFWLVWCLFLFAAMGLRYGVGITPRFSAGYEVVGGIGFYAIPYFFTLLLYSIYKQDGSFWTQTNFWLLSIGIILVLFLNQYVSFAKILGYERAVATRVFWHQLGYNLQTTCLYLLLPLLYGAWVMEGKETQYYGCAPKEVHWLPYLLMVLGMLPLLVWASFQKDFLQTYPRYTPTTAEAHWGISPIYTVGVYEVSYILQFISLEIFFRGFIVLALARFVGQASVFVMVSVYVFLHFWKPLPETIGSMAGGLLLGIFVYYSRSVYGGMIVHVGIALLMEILAWWQLSSLRASI